MNATDFADEMFAVGGSMEVQQSRSVTEKLREHWRGQDEGQRMKDEILPFLAVLGE